MSTTDELQRLFTSYGNAMYRRDPDAAEKIAAMFSAALAQQPAASGEPVAWAFEHRDGRITYHSALDRLTAYRDTCVREWPLYESAQPAPAPLTEDPWHKLYRRAINEANGLTNYVEDRPELRSAERRLTAIEAEARTLAAAGTPAKEAP